MLIGRQSYPMKGAGNIMSHSKIISAVLNRFQTWLAIALVPLLSSCASNSREAVLQPNRQYPADSDGSNLRTRGFLVAFTPEELHFDDKGARFYRHTSYQICKGSTGQPFKYVPNYLGKTSEDATVILLPAGPYQIKAQTAHGQPITISIVIRPAVTTTINLEDGRKPPVPLAGELYRVRLKGRNVGWVNDAPGTWPGKNLVE
jgi:hypothetical protein